jgi:hypothetical protein
MVSTPSLVISASRRTDIPAFFMPWFMEGISRGGFEVMNPYNRRVARIAATSPPVHTIVFWSKNFAAFLEGGYGRRLQEMGYHLYFQFTINSKNRILEPNLPGLNQRLEQLQRLCDQFGPRAVNWRFDPICFYRWRGDGLCSNLDDADRIAATAAAAGIRSCTTSIMDPYAKVTRRSTRLHGFTFVDPPREDKVRALLGLERLLATQRIQLYTCCECELLRALPADSSIRAGACIPSELFMELYGGTLSVQRDSGQRVKAGCGCRLSIDIGSYDGQRCGHDCLYCYASPASQRA